MSGQLPKLRAVKSFFVESGTYQRPALRTYETHYNDAIVADYLRDTRNGTEIVPNAFQNIGTSILRSSTAPTGFVNIDNGWNERRMSFVIEIAAPDNFTGDERSVVFTGYTDHADVSFRTTQLDPHMRLYFNTSSIINTITQRMGDSIVKRRVMTDSSHLLNMTTLDTIQVMQPDVYSENKLWYATPRNVIYQMGNLANGANGYNNDHFMDFRSRANSMEVSRSRRENAVPTTYLSKILRGVTDNLSSLSYGTDSDESLALTNASHGVSELDNMHDPVLMEILRESDYLTRGYVTWGQLNALVPNLDSATGFTSRADQVMRTNTPDAVAGEFNHWEGVGFETLIANNIAQLVPAMMTSAMIGTITFAFSNDNPTLTPNLTITTGQTLINGVPFLQVSPQFETRFLNEIAPLITDQNRTLINMIVQCALGTETFVSISRNGAPEIPFCAPTFCDGLYTPIISTSEKGLTDIASDLQNIANSVNTAQYMGIQVPQQQQLYY